jgi:predicted phosphodiesterase
MVKSSKIYLPVLLMIGVCCVSGCTVDLLGLFASNDLDKRLETRGNFVFLNNAELSPSFGSEYSFIVLTDTHIENENDHGLAEKLKALTDSDSEIKFAVITGDVTQCGYERDIQKFINMARSLNVPCYPVIGNHDIYFGNWSEWKRMIGSTCYRINGDGTTLFILDSANGFFGADQLGWLQREIKKTQGRVFVFTHFNIFVENLTEIQQSTDTNERARLSSILKNRCDAMFMGHTHVRNTKKLGNVQYITMEDYVDHKAYCRVSVSAAGISYEFKKL